MTVNKHIFSLALLTVIWIPFLSMRMFAEGFFLFTVIVGFLYGVILLVAKQKMKLAMNSFQWLFFVVLFIYFSLVTLSFIVFTVSSLTSEISYYNFCEIGNFVSGIFNIFGIPSAFADCGLPVPL